MNKGISGTYNAAGYTKVNIQPSFDLYELERGTTVGINIKFGEGSSRIAETPKNVDLANDIVTHWTLSSLGMGEIWMTLDEFEANPYLHFQFATNNRAGIFLTEHRAAKLSNFKIKSTIKKRFFRDPSKSNFRGSDFGLLFVGPR